MPRFFNLSLALLLILALAGCKSPQTQATNAPPPVPVSVAPATEESVPSEIQAVGTVEASAVIQVRTQVSGELTRVAFAEGSEVHKDDLLFEIDPRPYQDALRQAEAALSRDTAQMHLAEANLNRDIAQAKSVDADAARYAQLAKEGVVSRSQNEQSQASADALKASIQADRAAIDSAKAAVESDRSAIEKAKLDLSYCQIHSPVTGRVGNLLVHQGNLVSPTMANALVVINKLEPIWVSFGVPEEHLAAIRRISAARKMQVTAAPQDSPGQAARGELTVIDNSVDTTTGTIKLKATFANEKRLLWPGQFVNVALTLDTQARAVVVPAEAVQPGQKGQMVYVVKADQTVEPRTVTVGATHGNKVIIQTGVSVGENVVTDGQLRLFPGAKIQAVPASKIDSQTI